MLPALLLVVGALLIVAWAVASRRHLERRENQTAEWVGDERPDLWTSEAACVHCGVRGGLVEVEGAEVVHTCLSCGRRHVRSTRA